MLDAKTPLQEQTQNVAVKIRVYDGLWNTLAKKEFVAPRLASKLSMSREELAEIVHSFAVALSGMNRELTRIDKVRNAL